MKHQPSKTLVRFGVTMESGLLERFDRWVASQGLSSRSRALRDIVRDKLVSDEWEFGEAVTIATINLVYDHHKPNLQALLTSIQHDHIDQIVSTLHVHLDHDNCLEVLVVRGEAKEIKAIADKLITCKGVRHGKLNVTTTGENLK
ncbi:MAG: nickel-responsive transcriptional regulator NikR [Candidatus Hatepunaea meridiana]|nr:nickel-responsive transcriptional regulator NikR [Candidatus Hatepunaea meridiana]